MAGGHKHFCSGGKEGEANSSGLPGVLGAARHSSHPHQRLGRTTKPVSPRSVPAIVVWRSGMKTQFLLGVSVAPSSRSSRGALAGGGP